MLIKPPMEDLLPKTENRYTLAVLAAKRTRQLVAGSQPMAESESPSLVTLACEEIASGQVVEVHKIVEPALPLRPELELAKQKREEEEENELNLDTLKETLSAVQTATEETEQPITRSKIKILTEDDNIVEPEEYFGLLAEQDEDEDEEAEDLLIITDAFSEEAEALRAETEASATDIAAAESDLAEAEAADEGQAEEDA